jgi:hypothetical protein
MSVGRVKPKRVAGGYKTRERKIPGRKTRAELMGVRNVEVVQKTNGKMVAAAFRRLQRSFEEARKQNEKSEDKVSIRR